MLTIVLADDDKIFIDGVFHHVDWAALGIEVAGVAYNGLDALDLCKQTKPDILLTDVRMPCVNGLDAALQLRQALPQCHILFMSAYAQAQDYRSAIQLQALDFMEKPVDVDDITYALRHVVSKLIVPKEAEQHNQASRIICDVMRAVEGRYMEPLSVAQLADMFYLTPNYLSSRFHKETGYTIKQYIALCRVEAALSLLRGTPLSVQEISMRVGYQDARHFSKVFQKIMHMTPSAFRDK